MDVLEHLIKLNEVKDKSKKLEVRLDRSHDDDFSYVLKEGHMARIVRTEETNRAVIIWIK